METQVKKHVSFSETKLYSECAYRHKIEYIDGNKSPQTIHLIFGSAVHDAIDEHIKTQKPTWLTMCRKVRNWIRENPEDKYFGTLNSSDWCKQALGIYAGVFSWLQDEFSGAQIVGTEIDLYEPMELIAGPPGRLSDELNFKGFIDIVLKDSEGIYHICDFKTTSWGWNLEKRSDTIKQYQLTLYKRFYCEKFKIPVEKVKTHFILLKRTPAKNSKIAELITISSGNKKIQNANAWLNKNVKSMKSGMKIKNRTSCKFCPWHGTSSCT